jgi:hypothetical protein
MITIILCSRTSNLSATLKKNIQETIGLEYELIIIDNSHKTYSIFSAYNQGISQSKYNTVCFVHEDVLFHTPHWGNIVLEHLKDPSVGFIGVAGGSLAPRIPAPWSFDQQVKFLRQFNKKNGYSAIQQCGSFNNLHFQTVVTLDGVFLACRKELFNSIQFDENTFDGFHCYDQDICLQARSIGLENRVINNLLLEHFSTGSQKREWIECQLKAWRKWKNDLPISIEKIKENDLQKKETHYLKNSFLKKMVRYGYTDREILDLFKEYYDFIALGSSSISTDAFRLHWVRLLKKPSSFFHK